MPSDRSRSSTAALRDSRSVPLADGAAAVVQVAGLGGGYLLAKAGAAAGRGDASVGGDTAEAYAATMSVLGSAATPDQLVQDVTAAAEILRPLLRPPLR